MKASVLRRIEALIAAGAPTRVIQRETGYSRAWICVLARRLFPEMPPDAPRSKRGRVPKHERFLYGACQ